ncbi:anti-sigma F factor [Alicyclobacillus cycloheptanicus]|uniref:Anti-sigma F factor n=1 Tax=Alicyclobacillus cycloheptanicus TaxID=1457 RepID=A0ABT9XE68_9BACL|nr:anti-sigma F factor [Alicyclobacillus cycloheptanicus]MDQ0188435.1 stage II sporulation protein AB (anti-sigma F factor) [Alicyclobacillus cycloheptanicus]WDM01135.1 anti-sigma F factor [Alicyclobacillus cycloheptanicus]
MNDPQQNTPTPENYMTLTFPSLSENESFARVAVASFAAQLDPTMEQLTELKTAVSEAVTNAIIHGYEDRAGEVRIRCTIRMGTVEVIVEDDGAGISDVEQARQPLYTSRPELERSGMGITIMENFVDELFIESTPGKGTRVIMRKTISDRSALHS